MQRQRTHDTRPELLLRSELHRRGIRYRVHRRLLSDVRREADITFPKARIAVFVDGCFWHSCPTHGTMPRNNAGFWSKKLAENRRRDSDTDSRLVAAGWAVVRVWEHESPCEAASAILDLVRERT
jgi:DNA mismatch endonuclease (patch repair protein)